MDMTYFKPVDDLTFDTVVERKRQFESQLLKDSTGTICLDLGKVRRCDSAGLAFLIEAGKMCRKHNKQIEIREMSHEMHLLAEFCGVEKHIG